MAEESGSDKTLRENPLVGQLIAQGAEAAMMLRGYVGPKLRDGYVCLYPRLNNLSESIEIALPDILHSVEAPQSVLGAVILWVKKDAKISIRRIGVSQTVSDSAGNVPGMRKGLAGTLLPPNLVELRKGRLRMRVRAQQARALDSPYCEPWDDCWVNCYPDCPEELPATNG
jgi:hypothetical protein